MGRGAGLRCGVAVRAGFQCGVGMRLGRDSRVYDLSAKSCLRGCYFFFMNVCRDPFRSPLKTLTVRFLHPYAVVAVIGCRRGIYRVYFVFFFAGGSNFEHSIPDP